MTDPVPKVGFHTPGALSSTGLVLNTDPVTPNNQCVLTTNSTAKLLINGTPVSGGGGVTTLNSLAGNLNLTSTGSTVTVTPSGTSIDLEVSGSSFFPDIVDTAGVSIALGASGVSVTTGNNTLDDGGGNVTIYGALDVSVISSTRINLPEGQTFLLTQAGADNSNVITIQANGFVEDATLTLNANGSALINSTTLDDGAGNMTVTGSLAISNGTNTFSSGSGAPSSSGGVVGSYYFRTDGGGVALSNIYLLTVSGSPDTWVGIA